MGYGREERLTAAAVAVAAKEALSILFRTGEMGSDGLRWVEGRWVDQ